MRLAFTTVVAGAASALLLRAFGRALTNQYAAARLPGVASASVGQLLWCLPALAALGYLTAACVRSLPPQRPERTGGLVSTGLGPAHMRLLLAAEAAVACTVGALVALVGFLALRGHLVAPLPARRMAPARGAGNGLPVAAVATLLAVVPLLGGAAALLSVRVADWSSAGTLEDEAPRLPSPGYTATATALLVIGAALELGGRRRAGAPGGVLVRLPAFGRVPVLSLIGTAAAEIGLALAVPVLLYVAGQLLALGSPRAVRLLAGRGLQAESWRLGAPLAVLALVAGGAGAAAALSAAKVREPFALTQVALLVACGLGAALARAGEVRARRLAITAPLRELGAPAASLRASAALRVLAAGAVTVATAGCAAALALACTL